ncbi:MAG: tyrosine--tRNA ligase, partial [Myxococcales bacterium]|nr:tyrosine--tRNA ligase [Myxococcales bacterium]
MPESHMPTPSEQLTELKRGVVDLHVEADLEKRLAEGRPLRVKAGFDPTRPDLHLGHVVLMNKMRQFQSFGHEVVFIVGDFTAQIGDPSGKSKTRQVPTAEDIAEGAKSYAEQAFRILDPDKTRVVFNSEWLMPMRFDDVIRLAGKYTLARMMERDDFKRRYQQHESISIHELLY